MVDTSTEAVVLIHLLECDEPDGGTAPYDASVPGIGEVAGVSKETVADRVSLLSTLRELEREGLVESTTAPVVGGDLGGERNVYELTPDGRERARRLRREAESETVVIENGEREELPLAEADRRLDGGLAGVLARLSGDGIIYREDEVGERFVNRGAELDRLESVLSTVRDGSPRFVVISGEAGIGKTTLTEQFSDRARDRGFSFAVGRCDSAGGDPYGPIEAALSSVPGGDAVLETLRDDGVERGTDDSTGTTDGGLAVGDGREEVDARRESMFFEFADRLRELVAERPTVLFLDDLQWVPRGTLELLGYLARNVEECPLVLVGAYRPEDLPPDDALLRTVESVREDRRVELELDRFGPEETRGVVRWLLDTRSVPDGFVSAVQDHTGGNPLFVEETVKRLRERGVVDPDLDVYPDELPDGSVARAVEATIDMRLGTLDGGSMEALEVGAVIGETVDWSILSAVADLTEPALRDRVDVLTGARIWEPADGDRFRFTSGVIRETVIERMDDDRREELHEAIATSIGTEREDLSAHYGRIADHYDRAGNVESALEFYRMAAERATDLYAHQDAIDHYERALELARELSADGKVLGILENLGETYFDVGQYDESIKHYEYVRERTDNPETRRRMYGKEANVLQNRGEYDRALERLAAARDVDGGRDREESELLAIEGWIHHRTGDYDRAAELFERELALAEAVGDDDLIASGHHDLGAALLYRNELDRALSEFEAAMDHWDRERHRRANTLNNVGIAHRRRGDLEAATDAYERALSIAEETGYVRPRFAALSNLSVVYGQLGDMERAIEVGERARELAERIGDELGVAQSLGNLGEHHLRTGDLEAAEDAMLEAKERFEALGNDANAAMLLKSLGSIHLQRGAVEAALDVTARGIEIAERVEDDHVLALNHTQHSLALSEDGQPEAALEHARSAVEAAESVGRPETELDVLLHEGELLREVGRHGESVERLERAVEIAAGVDIPSKLVSARGQLGLSLAERGEPGRAKETLEAARSLAERRGLTDQGEVIAGHLSDLE